MELRLIIPGHYYMTKDDSIVLIKRINRDVSRGYWDEEKKEWVKCEPQTDIEVIRMRDNRQIKLNPDLILKDLDIMSWDRYIHEIYVELKRLFCIIFALIVAIVSIFT